MSKEMTIQYILDIIYGGNTQKKEVKKQRTTQYHKTHQSTKQQTEPIINNIVFNNITIVRDEPVEQRVCNESLTTLEEESIENRIRYIIRSF